MSGRGSARTGPPSGSGPACARLTAFARRPGWGHHPTGERHRIHGCPGSGWSRSRSALAMPTAPWWGVGPDKAAGAVPVFREHGDPVCLWRPEPPAQPGYTTARRLSRRSPAPARTLSRAGGLPPHPACPGCLGLPAFARRRLPGAAAAAPGHASARAGTPPHLQARNRLPLHAAAAVPPMRPAPACRRWQPLAHRCLPRTGSAPARTVTGPGLRRAPGRSLHERRHCHALAGTIRRPGPALGAGRRPPRPPRRHHRMNEALPRHHCRTD